LRERVVRLDLGETNGASGGGDTGNGEEEGSRIDGLSKIEDGGTSGIVERSDSLRGSVVEGDETAGDLVVEVGAVLKGEDGSAREDR
jgi:hypothetical protein